MPRVTQVVTDPRATHYWDGYSAIMNPYQEHWSLNGPCAGVFMVFGPGARWDDDGPPIPAYAEDAHSNEFDRELGQFDARQFAGIVKRMLP